MHPIEELVQGKITEPEELIGDIKYILMRDLHLGYREIKKMPLCEVLELLKRWNKQKKEEEKAIKKNKTNF